MRTLFLIFLTISISIFTQAAPPTPLLRPGQLQPGSEILIQFRDMKLLNEPLVWEAKDSDVRRRCTLKIASHFDEDLLRQTPQAIYKITQGHAQSWFHYERRTQSDQFNYWLSTDNKDLPLLGFSCYLDAKAEAKITKFTIENVEELVGQSGFFRNIVTEIPDAAPSASALDLAPLRLELEVLEDLHFSKTETSPGRFDVQNPIIKGGHCWLSHFYVPDRSTSYKEMVKKGSKLTALYFSETPFGFYTMVAEAPGYGLNLSCSDKAPQKNLFFFLEHFFETFDFSPF